MATAKKLKWSRKLCGVPSLTLGRCDLAPDHDGLHCSAGDGFAARCGRCREPLKRPDVYESRDELFRFICGSCACGNPIKKPKDMKVVEP